MSKILAIGAHADDVEIGCGATLSLFPERVIVVAFCDCGIEDEWHQSMAVLKPHNKALYKFPKRHLVEYGEDIRAILVKLKQNFQPKLIFTHHPTNLHQDHQIVARNTLRIFKRETVLGYDTGGGGWFTPNLYIPVTAEAAGNKIAMLDCYKSQTLHENQQLRFVLTMRAIRANMQYHGAIISQPYAEAFELLRGVFPID